MKKVFIDTNIVLDFALKREPFTTSARTVFDRIVKKEIAGYISTASITDMFYILRKSQGREKSLEFLKDLVKTIHLLIVSKEIIEDALYSEFKDFEDAVQYHTALTHAMDVIITRDTKDFINSDIPVCDPAEFLSEKSKE
jgi:predicted nucleic acid-binding protein